MDRFFKAKAIHPEYCGNNFSFCVDGPQLLRLCMQAESMQKSIPLRTYFLNYFDLRKEFQKLYKRPATSVRDMLERILLSVSCVGNRSTGLSLLLIESTVRGKVHKVRNLCYHNNALIFVLFREVEFG